MRTTISLEDDAVRDIRAYAKTCGISLGKAASELIRRGARFQLRTKQRNGIPVFDTPDDFPLITDDLVSEVLEEE